MDPTVLRRRSQGADVDLKNGDDPRRVPLDLILAATSDLIFVFDRKGRYLYANPLGARAFGLNAENIIGKTWRELGLPPELMLECDRPFPPRSHGQERDRASHLTSLYGVRVHRQSRMSGRSSPCSRTYA